MAVYLRPATSLEAYLSQHTVPYVVRDLFVDIYYG